MIDRGNTANITPFTVSVEGKKSHEVSFNFSDDSIVKYSHFSDQKVRLMSDEGPRKISLSETLVAPINKMNLFSVPELIKKNFLFFNALIIIYLLSKTTSKS